MKDFAKIAGSKLFVAEPNKLSGKMPVFVFYPGSGSSTEKGVLDQAKYLLSALKEARIEALVVASYSTVDNWGTTDKEAAAARNLVNADVELIDKRYETDPERRVYVAYSLRGQEPWAQVVNSRYTGAAFAWFTHSMLISSGLQGDFELKEIRASKKPNLIFIATNDKANYLQRQKDNLAWIENNGPVDNLLYIVQEGGGHGGPLTNQATYFGMFQALKLNATPEPVKPVEPPRPVDGTKPAEPAYTHPWATKFPASPLDEFGFGVSSPWIDATWSKAQLDELMAGIGFNTVRHTITKAQVEKWGPGVISKDLDEHDKYGLRNVMLYLDVRASDFKTMYEWAVDTKTKKINPKNDLAVYFDVIVSANKKRIRTWSATNEPDLTADGWNTPRQWETREPLPKEVPNIGGTIKDLRRIYQVLFAIVKLRDPGARVAMNASYPSFYKQYLAQNSGDSQPAGAEYDTVIYHLYPWYAAANANTWTPEFLVKAVLQRAQQISAVHAQFGYDGKKYPVKPVSIGETAVLHRDYSQFKGSDALQRETTRLLLREAPKAGIEQVLFFSLADHPGQRNDEYDYTGFYQDLRGVKPADVKYNGAVVRQVAR